MAFEDQLKAGKKYKAPKDYKPYTTSEKLAMAASVIPGGAIGKAAGTLAAKATAKKVGAEVLKASNKAKGSGKMVHPKPAMGKKTATAPKRDVVVKTEDKTLATNKFINRTGDKSVKVNTKKPTVRVVEKEVTRDMANTRTATSNRLRYSNAKADAARAREASVKASSKPKIGKVAGATTTSTMTASAAKKKSGK